MHKLRKQLIFHWMLLPGVVLVFIFSYIPMLGISVAFQDYKPIIGFLKSEWVGFRNFTYIFNLPNIYHVLRNTVYIAFMQIVAGLVVPIAVAVMLNEMVLRRLKRTIQTLIYLPHFFSWIIMGGLLFEFLSLDGFINRLLGALQIKPIYFLGSNDWFPFVLVGSNTWKEFGFSTIIYLAAITAIDPSLHEAATVDGAGRWRRMWHITLPGMRPIIVLMSTLAIGSLLNAGFEQVLVLYGPIVYDSGDIIDTFVYRLGLLEAQFGPATAVGLFKSAVSFILITIAYYLAYRLANYRIF